MTRNVRHKCKRTKNKITLVSLESFRPILTVLNQYFLNFLYSFTFLNIFFQIFLFFIHFIFFIHLTLFIKHQENKMDQTKVTSVLTVRLTLLALKELLRYFAHVDHCVLEHELRPQLHLRELRLLHAFVGRRERLLH